ncbi:unnamed protein product [Closterium sp. Naga37s-1]|nr:unnamed protein product [Closterium sp. Naga37s-1]
MAVCYPVCHQSVPAVIQTDTYSPFRHTHMHHAAPSLPAPPSQLAGQQQHRGPSPICHLLAALPVAHAFEAPRKSSPAWDLDNVQATCVVRTATSGSGCQHVVTQPSLDVSNNSLYGRINRNFRNMVADGDALINLAHNFFFGDAVLFAAGCQICPVEINEPNNLVLGDTSSGDGAGKCVSGISAKKDYSVAEAGKGARVSLAGNCLTLSLDSDCPSNATQRSTAACQAFCSITDNGPCDGHGECVPPAPTSSRSSNFTCLCHAGYSAVDLGNGSTCAVVNTTTTEVSSLSTGAIVGIAVGCFAGFTLLAAILAWVLWPRKQSETSNPFEAPKKSQTD